MNNETENAILRSLGRIEGRLDGITETHKDQETRIRAIERVRYLLTGVASLLGGSLGVLGQYYGSIK